MDATPAPVATVAPVASAAPSTVFDPSAPVPEEYDVFCHACGYSLVGLVGDRCPECGVAFDPNELPYARVPWLHRRRIGFWRAYWQTVKLVVLRPRAFAEELCRPVRISADDARRFRRLTIYLAATAAAAAATLFAWMESAPLRGPAGEVAAAALMLAGGWLAVVLFLRLATDMPLFIWKGLPSLPPRELAPLHHYAAAPVALLPVLLLVAAVVPDVAWSARRSGGWGHVSAAGVVAVVAAWLYLAWRTPLVFMKAATHCTRRRVALLAVYLPLHVLLMAFLTALLVIKAAVIVELVGEFTL